ncbi:OR4M1 protein, partial [Urocolius indicus]|nr:OR4M1 protein [Urocolius indicus]
STVTEFVLLGLSQNHEVQMILSIFLLLFYVIILPGNILLILTIQGDSQLGSPPLYFFLANLSFLDICCSSVTPPQILAFS